MTNGLERDKIKSDKPQKSTAEHTAERMWRMTLDEMKQIKQERGYSLAQLSEYSGVPLGTLQKIFSGETEHPRYATRRALEQVLSEEAKASQTVREASVYSTDRPRQLGEYTLEDYYTMPEDRRVELIEGVIYDMAAPSFVHQHLLGKLFTQISSFIESKNGDCLPMMAPVDVRLDCDDRTMVQPDILILCDRSKICKWGIMGAPDFCLEIVSESTRRKDYIKKLQKYVDAGVREYWILDPERRVLVTYDWRDDFTAHMVPLQGKSGLALYGEELQIDLDEIARLIQNYPD